MGYLDGTGLSYLISKIKAAFWSKTDVVQISIDNTPTESSNNLVKSGGVYAALEDKQDEINSSNKLPYSLISGTPTIPDEVEANPTVPSGTTPTTLQNVKVGNNYYSIPQGSSTTLSTDVTTDKSDNTKASTPKSVYDFVKPVSQSSIPVGGLEAGILYNLSVLTGSVTINLATPADANVANEYAFTFATGSTPPTITWPASLIGWAGNCLDSNGQPELKVSKFYEVSILNNIAIIAEVEI